MKKGNDELINLFRARLKEAEAPVREGFWEELRQDVSVAASRRRQIVHRFSAVASVLLILAGASAAFWYFSPKEEIANAFTQVAVSTGTAGSMGVDVVHEELPAIHVSSTSLSPASLKPAIAIEEYPDEESFSVSISMSYSFSSSSSKTNRQNKTVNRHDGNTSYAGGGHREHQVSQTVAETSPVVSVEDEKQRMWSVGAFASAGLLNDRIHSPHPAKHKQPFSIGLSVRKELSDRWGIESGLAYTQLNSELTVGEDDTYIQHQTLHYVGIPVKTDLSLYKSKRVNLYTSAGGMVEKCVGGDVKSTPLQLSLTAAVGVQYKLSDRFSLYAEPGLSYHFDDGSPVLTIRKEKPLNINLLCGVRMIY